MKKKSYKIISALLISGALLTGVFFITQKQNTTIFRPSEDIVVKGENSKIKLQTEIDTDGDGLLDWEEALWNTDPKNKDTDGDKTSDGIEAKSGRNPTLAGPNDSLDSNSPNTTVSISKKEETPLTPTEKLGRDLFAEYLALKQSGVVFDEQTTESFAKKIVESNTKDVSYKIYSEKDLLIAPTDNEMSEKAYGNALGEIVFAHPGGKEDDLIIYSRFVDTKDPSELEKLAPSLSAYRSILAENLLVPVPESAKVAHLAYVNSLSYMVMSLENMSIENTDPLTEMVNIERYLGVSGEVSDAILELEGYFETKHIVFSQNEAGYAFLNEI